MKNPSPWISRFLFVSLLPAVVLPTTTVQPKNKSKKSLPLSTAVQPSVEHCSITERCSSSIWSRSLCRRRSERSSSAERSFVPNIFSRMFIRSKLLQSNVKVKRCSIRRSQHAS
ncbi:hypothetical protein E6C27_scaffold4358G00160 [Cucumis melo var. makuwa]|uniref:Secreted protein n=1 Tax=Cucumis melo var. makuwa TaxID=1194695 RepID=A0A5A7U339_CUCMM|nr:hypothetical protein E6C27_scaffold4358G00160 [Cucumis melo var. makuwa]